MNPLKVFSIVVGLTLLPALSEASSASFNAQVTVVTQIDTTQKITADRCEAMYINTTGETQDYRIESNVRVSPLHFRLESGDYQVIRCRAYGEQDISVNVIPVG